EINASKCFVISLIENCQNQDDIDRFFDWWQRKRWCCRGCFGGDARSGGRGRDGCGRGFRLSFTP
ncbi:unnamed protein product, partial [Brassica rapa subsp. narinosa]